MKAQIIDKCCQDCLMFDSCNNKYIAVDLIPGLGIQEKIKLESGNGKENDSKSLNNIPFDIYIDIDTDIEEYKNGLNEVLRDYI